MDILYLIYTFVISISAFAGGRVLVSLVSSAQPKNLGGSFLKLFIPITRITNKTMQINDKLMLCVVFYY